MSRWFRSGRIAWVATLMVWAAAAVPVAQSASLEGARNLYAAASYDDALRMLDGLRASATGGDLGRVEYYRALCLLALGWRGEADAAIVAAETAMPFAQPETDASPTVRAVFQEVRRRILPSIVERRYADAKSAFDRREASASERFAEVVALIDDPDFRGAAAEPRFAEMRALAADYLLLSTQRQPHP